MARVGNFIGNSGANYYGKPWDSDTPITLSPWDSDVVNASEIGTTGIYAITMQDAKSYHIFQRVDVNPVSTDLFVVSFGQATKTSVRDAVSGRWTDQTSRTFDLTITDIP